MEHGDEAFVWGGGDEPQPFDQKVLEAFGEPSEEQEDEEVLGTLKTVRKSNLKVIVAGDSWADTWIANEVSTTVEQVNDELHMEHDEVRDTVGQIITGKLTEAWQEIMVEMADVPMWRDMDRDVEVTVGDYRKALQDSE